MKSKEGEVEIIAVDDGSTDHSFEICKKIAAEHSNVHVYGKKNEGVSSARNFGLDVAKGRYITFCDADDYYEAMAVTEMLKIIGGGYELVVFPFYLVPQNKNKSLYGIDKLFESDNITLQYIKDNFWSLLNGGMINSCWNHLYLRERIEELKLRFRTDMTFSEDGVFNVAYLRGLKKEATIRYFNQPLYNYVANEGQSTRKKYKKYFYMICLAWDNIDSFIGDEGKNAIYWRGWLSVIRNTIYHQDYRFDNIDDILSNGRTQEMIKNTVL